LLTFDLMPHAAIIATKLPMSDWMKRAATYCNTAPPRSRHQPHMWTQVVHGTTSVTKSAGVSDPPDMAFATLVDELGLQASHFNPS
jgi:hypothetical protein